MDAVCLRIYFDEEKEYFRQKKGFRQAELEIGLIADYFTRDQIREVMESHIANLLPHPQHPEIDDVYKVLNFFVKKCLKIEGAHLRRWDIFYPRLSQGNPSTFVHWFEGYILNLIEMKSAVPGSSMGIFFRVPSWLAPLVKFILEHDTGVQDELLRVGYRSFAWLNGSRGKESGAVSTLDGDTRAAVSFSVFCGYNIRECPECVGDGISFSGCGISEQQRHLTEQLSHQFHARVAGFQEVEEEEDEGEARDDLPLCSSILSPKAKNKKTAESVGEAVAGERGLPEEMAPASQQPSSHVTGNVGERGQAGVGHLPVARCSTSSRCSKCGIGEEVSLEEAQQKMDPMGLYKWDADELSMYCHPKEILGCFVRVLFRKCICGLWARKVGQNLQKNGHWTGFRKVNQCKNDFQARVRFIIGKERRKLFSVDDTKPARTKRKKAPEREHLAEKRAAGRMNPGAEESVLFPNSPFTIHCVENHVDTRILDANELNVLPFLEVVGDVNSNVDDLLSNDVHDGPSGH